MKNATQIISHKTPHSKPTFQISKYTAEQQKIPNNVQLSTLK